MDSSAGSFSPSTSAHSVHPAGIDHLHLGGIPKRIVGLCVFHLPFAVQYRAIVLRMAGQCAVGPRLGTLEIVIIRTRIAPG